MVSNWVREAVASIPVDRYYQDVDLKDFPSGRELLASSPERGRLLVQAAVVQIIEPIFEADFEDCSYGFRPGRNAHQALEQIAAALKAGKTEVYDADLEGYFDSIPHDKLMKCVRMRVVDGAVLGLIKQWLEAPVVEAIREEGKRERKPRYKVTRNNKGTPKGEWPHHY